jgi:hypothetical protein
LHQRNIKRYSKEEVEKRISLKSLDLRIVDPKEFDILKRKRYKVSGFGFKKD